MAAPIEIFVKSNKHLDLSLSRAEWSIMSLHLHDD